jgi:hypothetical protein
MYLRCLFQLGLARSNHDNVIALASFLNRTPTYSLSSLCPEQRTSARVINWNMFDVFPPPSRVIANHRTHSMSTRLSALRLPSSWNAFASLCAALYRGEVRQRFTIVVAFFGTYFRSSEGPRFEDRDGRPLTPRSTNWIISLTFARVRTISMYPIQIAGKFFQFKIQSILPVYI